MELGTKFILETRIRIDFSRIAEFGKTTLVNLITSGDYADQEPTIGFNMRMVTKGNVKIKLWDIGGQARFRSLWERYCRGVHAIVYVVGLGQPRFVRNHQEGVDPPSETPVAGNPAFGLRNKNDLAGAATVEQLQDALDLKSLSKQQEHLYFFHFRQTHKNVDIALDWLIKNSLKKSTNNS